MLNVNFFHTAMPSRPMGKYAHIVMLRETQGYALFQTDGELNRARVSAGVANENLMTRIALFKRKQTTPERLNGRELLSHKNFRLVPIPTRDRYLLSLPRSSR
jgi:CRISPR-associated protein Csc2